MECVTFNKQASVDHSLKLDSTRLLRNNQCAYKIFLGIAKQSQEDVRVVRLRNNRPSIIKDLCPELLEKIFQYFKPSERIILQRGMCMALITFKN